MASQVFLEVVISAHEPDRSGLDDDGVYDGGEPGLASFDRAIDKARHELRGKSFDDRGVYCGRFDEIGLGAFEGCSRQVAFRAEILNASLQGGFGRVQRSALDAAVEVGQCFFSLCSVPLQLPDTVMHRRLAGRLARMESHQDPCEAPGHHEPLAQLGHDTLFDNIPVNGFQVTGGCALVYGVGAFVVAIDDALAPGPR
ncbi:hypothetical protein [Bosea sp. (in: a-proteobacteria)]|uniref:hypothetical protein n=1 Tax=Bosea sp. (in: a-proteobacteria) TaxID=1871050 RepID=UPI0035620495